MQFRKEEYIIFRGPGFYEHTGHYPVPKWAKNMKLVKVLYPNTKQEISFWRR
jgi:hypothetical protein